MNRIFIAFIGLISLSCQSARIERTYDCSLSSSHRIDSEREAIEIATAYLNHQGRSNGFIKDSVQVFNNDTTFYEVSFLTTQWQTILPPNVLLLVRKSDGCVHQAVLE
jgi:hypothetical protein